MNITQQESPLNKLIKQVSQCLLNNSDKFEFNMENYGIYIFRKNRTLNNYKITTQTMQNSYLAQLDQLQEQAIQYAYQSIQDGQWTKEYEKNDCVIYSKMNQVGLKMTRTELKVKVDPKKAIDIMFDMTRRHEFDENFLEGKIVEKIDDNNVIYHGAGKSPMFLVDPRDMVALARKTVLQDGTYLAVSKSIEVESVPLKKDFTRCEILISAFLIKEISDGLSQVIIIDNLDPKGSIPKAIINAGISKQAEIIQKLMEKMRLYTLKN